MTSLIEPTLSLELTLQDVFFNTTSDDDRQATRVAPITSETWVTWFKTWLGTLIADVPKADGYELSLRLTDDKEIQFYNSQYRHKDQPTDVLAFAALEVDVPYQADQLADEPLYLGDIIISVETASRQATEQGHSLTRELAWLASHGFLHLLGWDHPDEESLMRMLSQQETLLSNLCRLHEE